MFVYQCQKRNSYTKYVGSGSLPWTGLRRICGGRLATIPCSSSFRRLPHIFSFQLLRWGFQQHKKSMALVHVMTHFDCRMQKEKSFTMRREDCAISDSSSQYSRYCFWTTNILLLTVGLCFIKCSRIEIGLGDFPSWEAGKQFLSENILWPKKT